jgi:hypothetical protein
VKKINRLFLSAILISVSGLSHGAASATTYSYTIFRNSGASSTVPRGVNESGVIAGTDIIGGNNQVFVKDGATVTQFLPPAASFAIARGISDSGVVVGNYNGTQGFADFGGVFTFQNFPGAVWTRSTGANNSGEIVGFYRNSGGNTSGFSLIGGAYSTISVPGSIYTLASDVNNSGEIVGYYNNADGVGHGFTETGGVFTTIDIAGASYTGVLGVDGNGDLAGFYADALGVEHPFIDVGGVITKLNVPGSSSTGTDAVGITNSGVVVGYVGLSDGSISGFIATPDAVPEPATWAMMLSGFGMIGFAMRKRAKAAIKVACA